MSRNRRIFYAVAIPLLSFSVLTSGFLIYDTMTGSKSLASTLRVIGFCPAGEENLVGATGATGAKGETGTAGALGPQGIMGACQAPMNLAALAANLVPAQDNTFSLGTAKLRWKDVQVGPGTIYLEDKQTGKQVGLTVDAGTLLLDNVESLRLGNIRITKNGIESLISGEDIRIGNISDRGYLSVANGIKFPDGSIFTTAPKDGAAGIDGSQGAAGSNGSQGATGSAGSTGASGAQGIQGVQGTSGNSFTIKGHYATYELFTAGAGSAAGQIGDAYFIDSNGALMVYGESAWFDSGRLIGPQGIQGVQGPKGDTGATGSPGAPGTLDPWGKQFVCVVNSGAKRAMYWGTCSSQGLTGTEYWILATFPK